MIFLIFGVILVPVFILMILVSLNQRYRWPWMESLLERFDELNRQNRRRRFPLFEGLFVLIVILAIVFTSRVTKPVPRWNEGEIVVVADSSDWNEWEEEIRHTFERIVRTPQIEKTFHIQYRTYEEFQEWPSHQLVVFFKTGLNVFNRDLPEMTPYSEALNLTDLREKGYSIGTLNDRWAFSQFALVMGAQDFEGALSLFHDRSDSLYELMDSHLRHILRTNFYANKEEKSIALDMLKNQGWALGKLSELHVNHVDEENNFVLFTSTEPNRWLSVHWLDEADSTLLNVDFMKKTRNWIGETYLGGHQVEPYYFKPSRGTFLGYPALITHGLWGDNDPVMGGPFSNYLFYDDSSRRVYMIDAFVLNIGKDKYPLLRRLQILAHTFMTTNSKG